MSFSLSNSGKQLIPGAIQTAATQSKASLSGAIGKLSSAPALAGLASLAKTATELPVVESPLISAADAKTTYKKAVETAQARQDETIALTYKSVFDSIKATSEAGSSSITIPLTSQQQSELVPLLERNGYTVTIAALTSAAKGGNSVEISWA